LKEVAATRDTALACRAFSLGVAGLGASSSTPGHQEFPRLG
jgi:hypothetical protein